MDIGAAVAYLENIPAIKTDDDVANYVTAIRALEGLNVIQATPRIVALAILSIDASYRTQVAAIQTITKLLEGFVRLTRTAEEWQIVLDAIQQVFLYSEMSGDTYLVLLDLIYRLIKGERAKFAALTVLEQIGKHSKYEKVRAHAKLIYKNLDLQKR